jgi:hypothetical protein
MPSEALPWLLLAVHVAVGLCASWWLRRGEAALHQVLRAVVAAAFRPLLPVIAAPPDPEDLAPRWRRRPGTTAADRPSAEPLQHSVVRRGPPAPVAA